MSIHRRGVINVRGRDTMRALLLQLTCGLIACLGTPCGLAQTAASSNEDAWHFAVTPYLWMAGLSGNTRIGPLAPQNVDAPFSDTLRSLSAAFMGTVEARSDRWVILLDTFYVGLSQTSGPLLGGALGNVKVELNQTILGLGGAYRVIQSDTSYVDVGVGVRYVNLDTHISFSPSQLLLGGLTHKESVNWADGIVAVRGSQDLSSRWAIYGYADLGTGGSKWSGQLLAGAQYKMSRTFLFDLGYRVLAEDYKTTTRHDSCTTLRWRARIWVCEYSSEYDRPIWWGFPRSHRRCRDKMETSPLRATRLPR